jgi:2-keto-3-deoxy-L-rhamnonate aldolase RhmA
MNVTQELVGWRNPVRARLEAGEFAIGATIANNCIESAALTATLGFHFLWVEMEHSPVSLETLRGIVLATRGLPALVFARVPVIEPWTAKRVLDQGVTGVIFPFVSDPEPGCENCRRMPLSTRWPARIGSRPGHLHMARSRQLLRFGGREYSDHRDDRGSGGGGAD